ncbi:MAG: hypothetical protein HY526_11465 [Betaproteobacteria bacterium]|nr:hypothetical protein [Betaproteobacteria bacterium]
MQVAGMLYGSKLLRYGEFPAAEIDDHINRGRNLGTRTAASQCKASARRSAVRPTQAEIGSVSQAV